MPARPLITLCKALALATIAASFLYAQEAGEMRKAVPVDAPILAPAAPATIPEGAEVSEEAKGEEMLPQVPRLTDFQADEIGLVFRTLARQARMNVVVSEAVQGTVTLRIENQPPREVIDTVMRAKGLIADEVNGVLFIKTPEERAQEPFENRLSRTADSVMGPIAKFKGSYYRKLIEAGVPENIAAETVLKEEFSGQELRPLFTSSHTFQSSGRNSFRSAGVFCEWLERLGGLSVLPKMVLHVGFAIAVFIRARRRAQRLFFFGPGLWGLATLIGGVFVAALYWLVNESSLRTSTAAS